MDWRRILAYVTGTVDEELLLRNEYLTAENRILRARIKGRLALTNPERRTLAEIGKRFLIHDRDPLFTEAFREILKSLGVEPLRLPPRSQNLNAFAERFVRSIKSECLDRMIFLGEAALRGAVESDVSHYHEEPNHQGLGNELIAPATMNPGGDGPVSCRKRLGGLLRFYHRAAA